MSAPVLGTKNENSAIGRTCVVTLTNAPSAGGIVVVTGGIYTGLSGGGAWTCTASGGSGVTITERYNPLGTADNIVGVPFWTVEYTTAPSSLTVQRGGAGLDPYMSICCMNVSGQDASYFMDANGSSGSGTSPVATALADLTDADALVIGGMTRFTADGTVISPASGWTQVTKMDESNATYQTLIVNQRTPGATGSYDPAWTMTGADSWWAAGISIKGAAGGGGGSAVAAARYYTQLSRGR